MRLTLKIVGGFTGPAGPEIHDVNLHELAPAVAKRFRDLVQDAAVFSLPAELRKPAPASWDFLYELTVEDSGRTRTIRFHLDAAPAPLRALCEALRQEETTPH
jgi:hypothetical protein